MSRRLLRPGSLAAAVLRRAWIAVGVVALASASLRAPRARAGSAPSRFVVDGDATVLDTFTQLVWQRHPAADPAEITLADARSYCAALSLPGGGWRLPSVQELHSLVDRTLPEDNLPLLDRAAFPEKLSGWFWTATPGPDPTTDTWIVDFLYANVQRKPNGEIGRVRCVRAN